MLGCPLKSVAWPEETTEILCPGRDFSCEFTELVHQAEKGAKLGDVCWCWELDDGTKLRWIGRDAVGADVEAAKGCLCLGEIEFQLVQRDSMLAPT